MYRMIFPITSNHSQIDKTKRYNEYERNNSLMQRRPNIIVFGTNRLEEDS
jgi:hypothetical protein